MTAPISAASGWLTMSELLSQIGHYDGDRFVAWLPEQQFTGRVEWRSPWAWSVTIGDEPAVTGSAQTQAAARAEVERRLAEHEARMRREVSP